MLSIFSQVAAVPLTLLAGAAGPPPPDPAPEPVPAGQRPSRSVIEAGAVRWTRWYWKIVPTVAIRDVTATCGPIGRAPSIERSRIRCFVTYTARDDGASITAHVVDIHRGCYVGRVRRHRLSDAPAASGGRPASQIATGRGVGLAECEFSGYVFEEE